MNTKMKVGNWPGPEYDSSMYFVYCLNRENAERFKKSLIDNLSAIYEITRTNIMDIGISERVEGISVWFLYMSDFDLPQEGWDKIEEIWKDSMS